MSALSSGNISKYGSLSDKYVLPEKHVLEKVATIKIFDYAPLRSELKMQINITAKQYQDLEKVCRHEIAVVIKKNLIYNNFNFNKFNTNDE